MLQYVHGGLVATAHATTSFTLLVAAAAFVFARVEMGTSKVGSGIVVGAVSFAVSAGFARALEPAWSFWGILANPDFANRRVVSFDMAAEFVVAVKA